MLVEVVGVEVFGWCCLFNGVYVLWWFVFVGLLVFGCWFVGCGDEYEV